MTRLKEYHCVWLLTHPHRSAEWLLDRMMDGFDVHHMDGNPANNDPANLCLIEHTDHMMIHNGGVFYLGRLSQKQAKKRSKRRRKEKIGRRKKRAYERYQEDQAKIVALAKAAKG